MGSPPHAVQAFGSSGTPAVVDPSFCASMRARRAAIAGFIAGALGAGGFAAGGLAAAGGSVAGGFSSSGGLAFLSPSRGFVLVVDFGSLLSLLRPLPLERAMPTESHTQSAGGNPDRRGRLSRKLTEVRTLRCIACGRDRKPECFGIEDGAFVGVEHRVEAVIRTFGGRGKLSLDYDALTLDEALALHQSLGAAQARLTAAIEEEAGESIGNLLAEAG